MIEHATWVVIADSEKYIILVNDGGASALDLRVKAHFEQRNPPTHVQGSDRPGRFSSPHGQGANVSKSPTLAHGRLSAVADTDWHQLQKQNAAKDLAKKINDWVRDDDCPAMVLVSDPKTLGVIRDNLNSGARKKIIGDLAKDLTNLPIEKIENLLSQA